VLHIQNEAELKKLNVMVFISTLKKQMKMYGDIFFYKSTLLEEMVLFRTRNGSIPRFIYGTSKWFYIEPFFLVKGSIGQVWNPRVLYTTQRNPYRTF